MTYSMDASWPPIIFWCDGQFFFLFLLWGIKLCSSVFTFLIFIVKLLSKCILIYNSQVWKIAGNVKLVTFYGWRLNMTLKITPIVSYQNRIHFAIFGNKCTKYFLIYFWQKTLAFYFINSFLMNYFTNIFCR